MAQNRTGKLAVPIIVALIGALGVIIAEFLGILPQFCDGSKSVVIFSGLILNSKTGDGVPKAEIRLTAGPQVYTTSSDDSGKYTLTISKEDLSSGQIQIQAKANKYKQKDQEVPTNQNRIDIRLDPVEDLEMDISEKATVEQAFRIVANELNVTVVFSDTCARKKSTASGGPKIRGSVGEPLKMLCELASRLPGQFSVNESTQGRKYEVLCY